MLEKDVWTKVHRKLKGVACSRIESGRTEKGIPDVFVQGLGNDVWVELKNETAHIKGKESVKVHWRSGQVAWAWRYAKAHLNQKCTYTIVQYADAIIIIPMTERVCSIIEDNYVPLSYAKIVMNDEWKDFDLTKHLLSHT